MYRIVFVGDSIFDNAAQVGGEPDTITQVAVQLVSEEHAPLRGTDGSFIRDISQPLRHLPRHAGRVIVRVRGNEVLNYSVRLAEPAQSVAEPLHRRANLAAMVFLTGGNQDG